MRPANGRPKVISNRGGSKTGYTKTRAAKMVSPSGGRMRSDRYRLPSPEATSTAPTTAAKA